MKWFDKVKNSFNAAAEKISSTLGDIINKKYLSEDDFQQLETALLQSDLGSSVTAQIIAQIKELKFDKQLTNQEIRTQIAGSIAQNFDGLPSELELSGVLNVILVCGVNGNGKTTTIAKMANYYQQQGKTIVMAACDTFRAAASEQLAYWANTLSIDLIKGDKIGADPASVAYKALEHASNINADIVFIDTAGRLNNNTNLMQELAKIKKIISKHSPNQPAYTLLVLDATTGQNAINQTSDFKQVLPELNGLIVTKIDSMAKAGTLISIVSKFKLPIYFLGTGEKITDLEHFNAQKFAFNLLK